MTWKLSVVGTMTFLDYTEHVSNISWYHFFLSYTRSEGVQALNLLSLSLSFLFTQALNWVHQVRKYISTVAVMLVYKCACGRVHHKGTQPVPIKKGGSLPNLFWLSVNFVNYGLHILIASKNHCVIKSTLLTSSCLDEVRMVPNDISLDRSPIASDSNETYADSRDATSTWPILKR